MSERRIVSTDGAPKANCSGQIAFDPATGQLVAGDIAAQTERVMKNLSALLSAAGTDFSRAVKCTVYLTDIAHFPAMNEVYARYFPQGAAPARATVAVAMLPRSALVEIDCVALV
jgi:2-iminobutanoate/2-iminopropanoate deaminase